MAKPDHTRVTWEGHTGASATSIIESWSFSLNAPDDAAISAASDAVLNAKAEAFYDAYVNALKDVMPSNRYLTKVTVASLDGLGKYRLRGDGSYIKGVHEGDANGDLAASGMPLQIALCVSLRTSRSGPTGKGRFFLPWPGLSLSTDDLLVPESQITGIVDDIAAFLGAVNDVPGFNLAVVSSKGYSSDVTAIAVGRAPDTMRSRREDLPEGYITAAVPQ